MMNNFKILTLICFVSCAKIKTPELPDMDTKHIDKDWLDKEKKKINKRIINNKKVNTNERI